MGIRNKLDNAAPTARLVPTPGWEADGVPALEVRSPSLGIRNELAALMASAADDASQSDTMNLVHSSLLVACCWVPDSDEKAFDDDDRDWLLDQDAKVCTPLIDAAMDLTGLTTNAEEAAGKD